MSKFSEQMTLTEVAAEMGISRQRVKQIENAALDKRQHLSARRAIRPVGRNLGGRSYDTFNRTHSTHIARDSSSC